MAFGNISTFYLPTSSNAGSSQWGSDVRKLLDSADAGNDNSTVTNHGTGGNVVRTNDPYTTSSSDSDQADYGWAVTPSDMGSTSTKKRVIFAGNHVATLRIANSGATAPGSPTDFLTMYAYRVGPSPSYTRTLLGSASVGTSGLGLLGAYATFTVTLNLDEIVFQADETIQYSFETHINGIVITGRTITFDTGTESGTAIRIDHPGLSVLAEIDGTASGSSTATSEVAAIHAATGTSSGSSTATASVGGVSGIEGAASGEANATAEVGAVSAAVGTAAGESTTQADVAVVKGTTGTADVGSGGSSITVRPTFGTFN